MLKGSPNFRLLPIFLLSARKPEEAFFSVPSIFFLNEKGEVKITDFGVSAQLSYGSIISFIV